MTRWELITIALDRKVFNEKVYMIFRGIIEEDINAKFSSAWNSRSIHSQMFFKIGVLTNFSNLLLLKRDSNTGAEAAVQMCS